MTVALRQRERVVRHPEGLLTRLGRSTLALTAFGLAMILVVVAVVGLVIAAFTGQFTSYVPMSATLPAAGNAVDLGAPVQYLNVTVGKVVSEGHPDRNGSITVRLHMIPSHVGALPLGVTASVVPDTIFGTEAIALVPPAHRSAARLAAGAVIPPATGKASASLQGTIDNLDYILNAVHPAQLDEALTAMAQALNGQGEGLGRAFVTTDTYLRQLLPQFPTMEADLALLAPVANQVAASTPALVGTLSNLSVTSRTVTSRSGQLHQLITGSTHTFDQTDRLLNGVQNSFAQVLADARPLLADLALTPTEVADILNGLGNWASAWSKAEANGPYLRFSASLPLADATDIVLAALGGPHARQYAAAGIGNGRVNPPVYTSAQCPRYGSLAGPSCRGSVGAAAADQPQVIREPQVTVSSAVVPGPAEQAAVSQVYRGLDGGAPPSSPAVSTLLLSPVLHQMVEAAS